MRKYLNIFVAGLSALLPISITVFFLYKVFRYIDSIFASLIRIVFGFEIIGLGFVLTLVFIFTVGILTKNYLFQKIMTYFENIMLKIPIIQVIYSGVKEISGVFTKGKATNFTQAVKIRFPSPDQISIGFITNESIYLDTKEKIAVFIPTTPNPANGFLVLVHRDDVEFLEMSIDKAIKLVVSMGAVAPREVNYRNKN